MVNESRRGGAEGPLDEHEDPTRDESLFNGPTEIVGDDEVPLEPSLRVPKKGVGLRRDVHDAPQDTESLEELTDELGPPTVLLDGDETDGRERGRPGSRQATIPLLGDEAAAGASGFATEEILDLEGEDTEEVFVILPEQLDDEIPVVETEAMPDELFAEATELVDEDYEGPTELAPEEDYEGPTEMVTEDELEQISSDLDDAVLGGDGEDYAEEFDLDLDGSEADTPRGRGWLVGVGLAAAAAVAFGGVYFWNGFFQRDEVSAASGEVVVAEGGSSATTVIDAAPPVLDARGKLREGVALALRLGFQAEVTDE